MVGFFLFGSPAKGAVTDDCTPTGGERGHTSGEGTPTTGKGAHTSGKGQHTWLFKNSKRNLKLLQMYWISENWGFSYFVVQIDFKEGRHIVLLIFTQSLEPHKILLIRKVEILFINCLANDAAFTNYMMRRRTRPLNWK